MSFSLWKHAARQNRHAFSAWIDFLVGVPRLRKLFEEKLGYQLDLQNPQSFSEKMQWRKLYDRNPLHPIFSDKVAVLRWLEDRMGADWVGEFCPPMLWVGTNPGDIPFDELPEHFYAKANHGSSRNKKVHNTQDLDRQELIGLLRSWQKEHHHIRRHEWAYFRLPRLIFVQPLLASQVSDVIDLKFHMYDGKLAHFTIHQESEGVRRLSYFLPDRTRLEIALKEREPIDCIVDEDLRMQLLGYAEKISDGLDYVRIDFMLTPDATWFGELTLFHRSGLSPFDPPAWDAEFGKLWTLPEQSNGLVQRAFPGRYEKQK